MTQSTNKFEQLLELLINEENEKAEQMFHEIVVEKSRNIYENLADSETETATTEAKDEAKEEDKKEEDKKEEVKETEKSDEKAEEKKDEAEKTDESIPAILAKPAMAKPALAQKSDEESIEEIGGDATDQLVKDISGDEEGEADAAADELGQDMDADGDENGEEAAPEERISDLEDALEELKAEFEKMLNGENGDEEGIEAEANALAPVIPAQETQPEMSRFEGKDAKEDAKAEKKETVKEYKIKKTADNKDNADQKKSPVASKGGAKQGGTSIKTGSGAEDKGRAAPTAEKMGSFENSPGKDKSTSMKKEVKPDKADHSDKSAKSPVKSN